MLYSFNTTQWQVARNDAIHGITIDSIKDKDTQSNHKALVKHMYWYKNIMKRI